MNICNILKFVALYHYCYLACVNFLVALYNTPNHQRMTLIRRRLALVPAMRLNLE